MTALNRSVPAQTGAFRLLPIRYIHRWMQLGRHFATCLIALSWLSASFSARAQRAPEDAVRALNPAEGLEITLFASEPMLANPANLDVDERGRVWVCEALRGNPLAGLRNNGDRILILDDTDGDGKADQSTVFYQGPDVNAAKGITVLGNKVIVSCSPNVIVFTDINGDGHADTKQFLFTNLSCEETHNNDAANSVVFGPDGRLYWNFGRSGHQVCDPNGQVITAMAGNPVVNDGQPYRGGMAFRCDPDGGNLEVLGHNFSNNGEVAVDSFGSVWQSDDGDASLAPARVNFVMEHGNFGFRDERDGSGWREWRLDRSREIARQRWHQNDPGVTPNFLDLGPGKHGGLAVYEGGLLPPRFQNQIIHCHTGAGKIQAYSATKTGSGYRGEAQAVVDGSADPWFQPVDLSIAPDGSLFVSDFYAPAPGGENGDGSPRGRIYRIAPEGKAYARLHYDFETAEGSIAALMSPNLSARFRSWAALATFQDKSVLGNLLAHSNPRFRARGLWFFSSLPGNAREAVALASFDPDEDIRAMGPRMARARGTSVLTVVRALLDDPSPVVRRECALALRGQTGSLADQLWAELALRYNREDRWYLEALGIGADLHWDDRMEAWLSRVGDTWVSGPNRDIVWRSRASQTPEMLAKLALDSDPATSAFERYVRAMHFQDPEAARPALLRIFDSPNLKLTFAAAVNLTYEDLEAPERIHRIRSLIEAKHGKPELVQLIDALNIRTADQELLDFALAHPDTPEALRAVQRITVNSGMVAEVLSGASERAQEFIRLMGRCNHPPANETLAHLILDDRTPMPDREAAIDALGLSPLGAADLLALAESGQLPQSLQSKATRELADVPWPQIREQAVTGFGENSPAPSNTPAEPDPSRN